MRARTQRGVTLVELLIAITLVAALSVGMLMAMRTSLLTLQKIDDRFQSNRRVMNVDQILSRQIGGVMPIAGECAGPGGLSGTAQMLHLVSTYSVAEGARGAPQVLDYEVAPSSAGGVRLIVSEQPCFGANPPVAMNARAVVLADRLAFCRFSYRPQVQNTPLTGDWVAAWNRPRELPAAVRVEMAPLAPDPTRLPLASVTVPIHVTGIVGFLYADTEQ